MNEAKEIIAGIRTVRLQKNIPNRNALELQALGKFCNANGPLIAKLANLDAITEVAEKDATAAAFIVGTSEYAVPLGNSINVEEELEKLNAELKYLEGFLESVNKKLGNERFVSKAPEAVVAAERKKQADAESKIATIKESIAALTK